MLGLIFGGILKRAKDALWAIMGFVRRYPLQTALIVAVGLSGWLWHRDSVHVRQLATCQAARKADRQAYVDAEAEAAAKAIAALRAQEARYQTKAKEADNEYQGALSDARTDADRFIADGGMRDKAARSARSPTATSPQGGSASLPVEVPGLTLVDNDDVHRCSDVAAYAVKAHGWAVKLNAP